MDLINASAKVLRGHILRVLPLCILPLAQSTNGVARYHQPLPPKLITSHAATTRADELRLQFANGVEALAISNPQLSESACICAIPVGSCHQGAYSIAAPQLIANIINNGFKSTNQGARKYLADCELAETFLGFSSAHSQLIANTIDLAHAVTRPAIAQYIGCKARALINSENPIQRVLRTASHDQIIDKTVAELLMNWHKRHYRANRMRVVLLSALSISELQAVLIASFGKLTSGALIATEKTPKILPEQPPRLLVTQHHESAPSIQLIWEINNDISSDALHRPATVLAHAMKIQAAFPDHPQLHDARYIKQINIYEHIIAADKTLLEITYSLTHRGLSDLKETFSHIFASIEYFKSIKINKKAFKHIAAALQNRCTASMALAPLDKALYIAKGLLKGPIENYTGLYCAPSRFSSQRWMDLLDELCLENATVIINAPDSRDHCSGQMLEKALGHSRQPPCSLNRQLRLPETLPPLQSNNRDCNWHEEPHQLLSNDSRSRFSWVKDSYFNSRQAGLAVRLYCQIPSEDTALSMLMQTLAMQRLNSVVRQAYMIGLQLCIQPCERGWYITAFGREELIAQATLEVLRGLRHLSWSTAEFQQAKDELCTQLQQTHPKNPNTAPKQPGNRSILLQQIHALDEEALYRWQSSLWKRCFYRGLLYGSTAQHAHATNLLIDGTLNSEPYAWQAAQIELPRTCQLMPIQMSDSNAIALIMPSIHTCARKRALYLLYARWLAELLHQKLGRASTAPIFIHRDHMHNATNGDNEVITLRSRARSTANLMLSVRSLLDNLDTMANRLLLPEQFTRLRDDLLEQFSGAPESMMIYFEELAETVNHPVQPLQRADIAKALLSISYQEALERLPELLKINCKEDL